MGGRAVLVGSASLGTRTGHLADASSAMIADGFAVPSACETKRLEGHRDVWNTCDLLGIAVAAHAIRSPEIGRTESKR